MLRILVVDDQPHILRVVKMGLEKQGYAVTTARNGEEAFALLLQDHFDVVVTDMDMPRMDGKTLCQKVADTPKISGITIYLVTAKIEVGLRDWADRQSNITFLEKPLSLRSLNERLRDLPTKHPAA